MSLNIGNSEGFFSVMFNDCRIYGTAMLLIMVTIVYIGVKYVNYSANVRTRAPNHALVACICIERPF